MTKINFFSHNKFRGSKLKYVKNYLRNSITQYRLESFILVSVEKDILTYISTDTVIIDKVALDSES